MTDKNTETAISEVEAKVTHNTTGASGVDIHYVTAGEGEPILFIHGFPDHWLTWWHQIQALSDKHQVAAMDLRGFNLSAQPTDKASYDIHVLISDVEAVINALGGKPVTLVGHDWGGFVAWYVAMMKPELVKQLAVVNIPHPWAVARELVHNEAQQEASAYARLFQTPGAHKMVPPEQVRAWVQDAAFMKRHEVAMQRSNIDAMLNYYRVLFPRSPYEEYRDEAPLINVPTLVVYGTKDPYLLANGLNNVWDFVSGDLTIKAWPDAGHFAQHEQPARLSRVLIHWLHEKMRDRL